MPDPKNNFFEVNLPLKRFRATVANADTGSQKSLHTISVTYLDHILARFESNRMVRNVQNFELLNKNPRFLKPFLTKS